MLTTDNVTFVLGYALNEQMPKGKYDLWELPAIYFRDYEYGKYAWLAYGETGSDYENTLDSIQDLEEDIAEMEDLGDESDFYTLKERKEDLEKYKQQLELLLWLRENVNDEDEIILISL